MYMPFYEINENNINILNNIKKPSLIRIHSLSCYWCKLMTPEFNKLKNNKKLKNINIFDIEASNLFKINLPFVEISLKKGVPQLYLINKNGEIIKEYTGDRTEKDMLLFAEQLIKNKKSKKSLKNKKTKKNLKNKKSKKVVFKLKNKKTKKNISRTLTPWKKN